MTTARSLKDVLAALGAGATLLVGCADAPPPAAVSAQEVPAAAPAVGAHPDAAGAVAPVGVAAPTTPPLPSAAPAAPAAPVAPGAKIKPAKIPNSKRVVDKSANGCCGAGTCSPC